MKKFTRKALGKIMQRLNLSEEDFSGALQEITKQILVAGSFYGRSYWKETCSKLYPIFIVRYV